MQKYSIWVEHETHLPFEQEKVSLVIYREDEERNRSKPVMTFDVHDADGVLALSNGALVEYHLVTESFGIMFSPNGNTHIYRDGDVYAIITEDELEWVVGVPDNESYVWMKRD